MVEHQTQILEADKFKHKLTISDIAQLKYILSTYEEIGTFEGGRLKESDLKSKIGGLYNANLLEINRNTISTDINNTKAMKLR